MTRSGRPGHARAAAGALLVTAGLVAAALAGSSPAEAAPADSTPTATASAATSSADAAVQRVIITTKGATPTAATLDRQLGATGGVTKVRRLASGVAVVTLRHRLGGSALHTVSEKLEALPSVKTAVPDRRIVALDTAAPVVPTDTWFGSEWDLWDRTSIVRAGGYGIDAPRAWKVTTGSTAVTVAVLDTGITAHPDLAAAHLVPGYDFVTNDAADGIYSLDGDDWDADPADPGDYCSDDGETLADSDWHGTFVTGEIAASHDDGYVAGEAPGVRIEPVRVLGGCGGSESDEIAAIEWAAGRSVTTSSGGTLVNPNPAQVISMSLGAEGTCDSALQQAVTDAIDAGSVVVSAAGNESQSMDATGDSTGSAPANCTGVVRVTASTRSGGLADYSDLGDAAVPATIAAPGGDDDAPIIGDSWKVTNATTGAKTAGIAAYEGTSMATPRVSAAIALLLSHTDVAAWPAGSALRNWVVSRLAATATPFPKSASCSAAKCGAGMLDVGDLVGAPARFVNLVRPHITGGKTVGATLRTTGASWRPAATRTTVQWLRNGVPIAGATGTTYRIRASDKRAGISVRVYATRAGYDRAWRTSSTLPVVG